MAAGAVTGGGLKLEGCSQLFGAGVEGPTLCTPHGPVTGCWLPWEHVTLDKKRSSGSNGGGGGTHPSVLRGPGHPSTAPMSLYPALPPGSGTGIASRRVFSLGWREGRCPPHPVPGADMLPSQNLNGCHASFPRPLTIPVLIGKWRKRLHFMTELIWYLDRRFARRFAGGNGSSVYHRRAPAGRRALRPRAAGAGGLAGAATCPG